MGGRAHKSKKISPKDPCPEVNRLASRRMSWVFQIPVVLAKANVAREKNPDNLVTLNNFKEFLCPHFCRNIDNYGGRGQKQNVNIIPSDPA